MILNEVQCQNSKHVHGQMSKFIQAVSKIVALIAITAAVVSKTIAFHLAFLVFLRPQRHTLHIKAISSNAV